MSDSTPVCDDLPGLPGKWDDNLSLNSRPWLTITRPAGQRPTTTKDTERGPRPFLTTFPFEIRQMIYGYALTCNNSAKQPDLEGYVHSIDPNRALVVPNTQFTYTDHQAGTAILRTCRQIYEEASPMLQKSNIFVRVESDQSLEEIIYSACVPILALGEIADQFKQPAVEFVVPSTEESPNPAKFLMLASSLSLLSDALTTDIPREYDELYDEDGRVPNIYLIDDEGYSAKDNADRLRLSESCGRKMTLQDQEFVLSSFRRHYYALGPGARCLKLYGPWDAGLVAAARTDMKRRERNVILGGHPERTCHFVELAKAYHRKGELRNAARYFGVALSRLNAVAHDFNVTGYEYLRIRHAQLSYVVCAYMDITLFDLLREAPFESLEASKKVLHNVKTFEERAVGFMEELTRPVFPIDGPEMFAMLRRPRAWVRLGYSLGICQNPILTDPCVRDWACDHEVTAEWMV